MADQTTTKIASKTAKGTSVPAKVTSKSDISASDHVMGILTKAASGALKTAGKKPSLSIVAACVKSQTGTAKTPQSADYLRSFTTDQDMLNSIGGCINDAFGLQSPYRWRPGRINSDWTVGVLAATTDVFRNHQPKL